MKVASATVALGLVRFRTVANPVTSAAEAIGVVNVFSNADEDFAATVGAAWLGNPKLLFPAHFFDAAIPLAAVLADI